MKKGLMALATFSPALLFAETPTAPEGLSDAVEQLQGAATASITAVRPAIVAILVALFALVAIGFAWKYIRKFIGR